MLETPEYERGKKLADLARFDYINGELFHERLALPDFDRAMREKLLYKCQAPWACPRRRALPRYRRADG
jgi:hypothetical protein